MSDSFETYLNESETKDGNIVLKKLPYELDGLAPILSKDNVDWHYNVHTKAYIKNAKAKGDEFNTAGAVLHNLWWEQLKAPKKDWKDVNHPAMQLIVKKHGDLQSFLDEAKEKFMSIQGSGWLIMLKNGSLLTVKSHTLVDNIALVIDGWEHAWYPTYGPDKAEYFDRIWEAIDWDIIEKRIND